MSARFDAATDFYSATTGLPAANVFSVTCFALIDVDTDNYANICGGVNAGATATWAIATAADGTTIGVYDSANYVPGVVQVGSTAMTVGTWWRIGMSVNGANLSFYRGAVGDALAVTTVADFTPPNPATSIKIGEYPNGTGFSWNGRIAGMKWWSVDLTADEIAAELAQFDPVRTANLLRYHPFHLAETTDRSGNGNTLTAGSTATATDVDPPFPVAAVPAWVADRGTTADATAATTSTVTIVSPTTVTVGNYLIARVAVDNSGTSGAAPGCTITDSRNTWTVLGPGLADPGAASAGATAYLCYAKVDVAYQAADTLTFNWGGISTGAKAIVVEEWWGIERASPVAVTAVTNDSVAASSTTAVAATIVPTAAYQLVYTCLADEGIAGDSITYDADTTNGSWVTLTRTASANATATNNQCVAGQYKVVSAGGSQTWNATITSRDWAVVAVVFSPTQIQPKPNVSNQAALVRAGSW